MPGPEPSSSLSFAFDHAPEPLAVVEGDAIHTRNAAWRAHLGEAPALSACVDPADHPALARALDEARRGSASLSARLAGSSPAGAARSFSLWTAGGSAVCVRLDAPAPAPPAPAPAPAAPSPKTRALLHVFDVIDAILWTAERDGTVTLSEGRGLAHYQMKPGQMVGTNLYQLPQDTNAYKVAARTLAGEHLRVEYFEERSHWVNFTEPVRGDGGEIASIIGLAINIHENLGKTQSARHLMDIINTLPLIVWAMDADGTSTLSTGKGLEWFGLAPGEIVGTNLLEYYRGDPTMLEHFRRVLSGEAFTADVPLAGRLWRTSYFPSRNGMGDIVGVHAVGQDITERIEDERRMQEQLATIQAQQRAITELVSPVIEVWRGVLVVPLIGSLTDDRAALLTERLLDRVVHRGAAFAILDLTGVDTLDTHRAQHLFRIMRSLDLLGCTCLFSGLRPAVASAMVSLDIDIPDGRTHPTLAEALRRCLRSPALRG